MHSSNGLSDGQFSPANPQEAQTAAGSFERFSDLPPEVRARIWEAAAFWEPPRILTLEMSSGSPSIFNLCSKLPPLAFACKESRELSRNAPRDQAISGDPVNSILAASAELDMAHFGPDFCQQHLGRFRRAVGLSKAANVRYLVLEFQVRETYVPRFFEICQLFLNLRSIVFVMQEPGHGSDRFEGPISFVEEHITPKYIPLKSRKSTDTRIAAFEKVMAIKEMARTLFPFCLEGQLSRLEWSKKTPQDTLHDFSGDAIARVGGN